MAWMVTSYWEEYGCYGNFTILSFMHGIKIPFPICQLGEILLKAIDKIMTKFGEHNIRYCLSLKKGHTLYRHSKLYSLHTHSKY